MSKLTNDQLKKAVATFLPALRQINRELSRVSEAHDELSCLDKPTKKQKTKQKELWKQQIFLEKLLDRIDAADQLRPHFGPII